MRREMISQRWGHAAFVQGTAQSSAGCCRDNRNPSDLWHRPSVCRTPWSPPPSLSLPSSLRLGVRQDADAYPHSYNPTWHHTRTPIMSPLIKCVRLSGRHLSPFLLSVSGFHGFDIMYWYDVEVCVKNVCLLVAWFLKGLQLWAYV